MQFRFIYTQVLKVVIWSFKYSIILMIVFSKLLESTYNKEINPIALRKAQITYNFGLSECNRVNKYHKKVHHEEYKTSYFAKASQTLHCKRNSAILQGLPKLCIANGTLHCCILFFFSHQKLTIWLTLSYTAVLDHLQSCQLRTREKLMCGE